MSHTRWGITVYENRYLNLSVHIKIYLDWNKQGRTQGFLKDIQKNKEVFDLSKVEEINMKEKA
jgi:hypothetical protein